MAREKSGTSSTICAAIRDCELLEFDYDGLHRVVAPYCHGFTAENEVLRAIQIRGASHSRGMGFGKLWTVEKMLNVRATGEAFVPDDPHYNPNAIAVLREARASDRQRRKVYRGYVRGGRPPPGAGASALPRRS
jgi:hypothetical protein